MISDSPVATQEFRREMGHVSRHSAVYFAGTIFNAAAGYLFKVYLARVLGAAALGIYALGMTVVGFLGTFNALGLPQSAVRFVAEYCATGKWDRLRGFLGRTIGALLISNVILGAAVLWIGPWIALHFYHTPRLSPYLWLFVLIMVLGVLNTFCGQVLAGYRDIARRTLISTFVATSLTILFTVALIAMGKGLWGYIAAQAGSAAVVLLLLMIYVVQLTPAPARLLHSSLPALETRVFRFSAVVFGMDFLNFVLAQADKVLIGFYLDARSVGIYAVAAAMVAFVPIVLQSVNQIFSPTIASLQSRGESELLLRMFQTLTKWILVLTVPLAASLIVFARPLMAIFGHEFEVGWPVLVIGTIGQFFNCAVGSVGYLLLMSNRQRKLLRIQTTVAVLILVLNIILIPRSGILGAAVATALANIITNLWSLREVHSQLGLSPYNRTYVRVMVPALASVAILGSMRLGNDLLKPAWLLILVSTIAAYLALIAGSLVFGLDEDDRLIAQAVWQRLRGMYASGFEKATPI